MPVLDVKCGIGTGLVYGMVPHVNIAGWVTCYSYASVQGINILYPSIFYIPVRGSTRQYTKVY